MIFGPVLAMFTFRIGIRYNNPNAVRYSRLQFTEIFYGKSHPKYQRIELYELLVQTQAPRKHFHF